MFGRIFNLFFVFALASIGCADPKYIQENIIADNDSKNEKSDDRTDKGSCKVQFEQSGLCFTWFWEKKPNSSQNGAFVFKTYHLSAFDKTPIESNLEGKVEVILWMPNMGHGSTPVTIDQLDIGTYRASKVFFIMPGEWVIKIQAKKGESILDEVIVPINI